MRFGSACDGDCGAAKALRDERDFLRQQVKDLQAQVANMADPLIHARLAKAARPQEQRPARRDEDDVEYPANAGLLRNMPELDDKPREFPLRTPSAEEVEALFNDE